MSSGRRSAASCDRGRRRRISGSNARRPASSSSTRTSRRTSSSFRRRTITCASARRRGSSRCSTAANTTRSRCRDVPIDPLKFRDERRYADRLKDARTKTSLTDAVKVGFGKLDGLPVTAAVQDFDFMGGSLGMAAGEAVICGLETAANRKTPFIMFAASGGARMQEGILSLMQLPRTTVAVLDAARGEQALHRRADQSDHRRRHRVLRHARRRAHRRARRADRLCRPARDRADHPREAAGRLPARRISRAARHGRHGGAPPPVARDALEPVPPAEQGAGRQSAATAGRSKAHIAAASRTPSTP